MLRDSAMPWLVQQDLRERTYIFRPVPETRPVARVIYESCRPDEHAQVEVDLNRQIVGYRIPGAAGPYATWPITEYLYLTRRELEELYL